MIEGKPSGDLPRAVFRAGGEAPPWYGARLAILCEGPESVLGASDSEYPLEIAPSGSAGLTLPPSTRVACASRRLPTRVRAVHT